MSKTRSSTRLLERAASPFVMGSAALFAGLSALRNKRFFHPEGDAYSALVTLEAARDLTLPLPVGTHDGLVRFSRGIGLPENLPDFLGLAIKIPDLYGTGRDQDLVFVTSGGAALTRHLLLPTQTYAARPYSSVLPYEIAGGRLVALGADVDDCATRRGPRTRDELASAIERGDLRVSLWAAEVGGERVSMGSVTIKGDLPGDVSGDLRFNPWNSHEDLRPAGALNRLRKETYSASQEARPDSDESDPATVPRR